jgi:hypothetical protein
MRSRVEHVPVATAWLLAEIAEARGRQELFTRQSPRALKALREMALVQSVESSKRIEGVEVAPERLRPLVLVRARPADRSEAEPHGCREALGLTHADAGDAGQWKRAEDEIVEPRRPSRGWHEGQHDWQPWAKKG